MWLYIDTFPVGIVRRNVFYYVNWKEDLFKQLLFGLYFYTGIMSVLYENLIVPCMCSFVHVTLLKLLILLHIKFWSIQVCFCICSDRMLGVTIFQTVGVGVKVLNVTSIMFSSADPFYYQVGAMEFPFWKLLPQHWLSINV